MNRRDQQKKELVIHREFESDRLSPNRLADAYEKVIPKHIRVCEGVIGENKAPVYEQQTKGA